MASTDRGIGVSLLTDRRSIILLKSRQAIDTALPKFAEAQLMTFAVAPDTLY